jgi:hypothetical protein
MVGTLRNLLLLGFMVALGILGYSRPVAAQALDRNLPVRNSVPYRPKLSPYLDLLRHDNSVLSPYHSFVVPRRELHQQQARQAAEINRLNQATFGRAARSAVGSASRLPTGTGSRFQTYLHFFGSSNRLP